MIEWVSVPQIDFAEIVRATAPRLVRLAARLVGDAALAEDLVQEAYLRAYDAMHGGRFDGRSEVATWLYRIVTNVALDWLRRRKRRANPAPEESSSDGPRLMEARAALRTLGRWLAELPPDQRTALVLKELEGLSTAEIARTLGISEGAAEQLLVRGRAALRERRGRE